MGLTRARNLRIPLVQMRRAARAALALRKQRAGFNCSGRDCPMGGAGSGRLTKIEQERRAQERAARAQYEADERAAGREPQPPPARKRFNAEPPHMEELTNRIRKAGRPQRHIAIVEGVNEEEALRHRLPIVPLTQDVQPWERQPKEPDKAWRAFLLYRDMTNNERSQTAVAVRLGLGIQHIHLWAHRFQWVRRVYEYSLYLDRVQREEVVAEIRAMAKSHARQSQLYMTALTLPATALLQRMQREPGFMDRLLNACERPNPVAGQPSVLDVDKTLAVMDTLRKFAEAFPKVAQMERLSRGEPTDINRQENSNEQGAVARAVFEDPATSAMASALFERLQNAQGA